MVDIVVPKPRIDQLFDSPSDDGRMFPITYSEAKKENTLGLTFAGDSKAAPASVRFYNPGAIAARTSDAGHKLLGAVETSDLPAQTASHYPRQPSTALKTASLTTAISFKLVSATSQPSTRL